MALAYLTTISRAPQLKPVTTAVVASTSGAAPVTDISKPNLDLVPAQTHRAVSLAPLSPASQDLQDAYVGKGVQGDEWTEDRSTDNVHLYALPLHHCRVLLKQAKSAGGVDLSSGQRREFLDKLMVFANAEKLGGKPSASVDALAVAEQRLITLERIREHMAAGQGLLDACQGKGVIGHEWRKEFSDEAHSPYTLPLKYCRILLKEAESIRGIGERFPRSEFIDDLLNFGAQDIYFAPTDMYPPAAEIRLVYSLQKAEMRLSIREETHHFNY